MTWAQNWRWHSTTDHDGRAQAPVECRRIDERNKVSVDVSFYPQASVITTTATTTKSSLDTLRVDAKKRLLLREIAFFSDINMRNIFLDDRLFFSRILCISPMLQCSSNEIFISHLCVVRWIRRVIYINSMHKPSVHYGKLKSDKKK